MLFLKLGLPDDDNVGISEQLFLSSTKFPDCDQILLSYIICSHMHFTEIHPEVCQVSIIVSIAVDNGYFCFIYWHLIVLNHGEQEIMTKNWYQEKLISQREVQDISFWNVKGLKQLWRNYRVYKQGNERNREENEKNTLIE